MKKYGIVSKSDLGWNVFLCGPTKHVGVRHFHHKQRQFNHKLTNSDVAEYYADKYDEDDFFDEDFYEESIGEAMFHLLNGNLEKTSIIYNSAKDHLERSIGRYR